MDKQNFLFIGGGQDGLIMSVPQSQSEIRFPVFEPQKILPLEASIPTSVDYKVERYFLERLPAEDETFFLYRHESLRSKDVLKRLLEGYKPG